MTLRARFPSGPTDPEDAEDPGQAAPDPAVVARNIMLRKLTASARTRSELAQLLAERGIPDEVATSALDRFVEVGLIDDAAFAANYVAARSANRGRTALRGELKRRGVQDELASQALDAVAPADERANAVRLVTRKLPTMAGLDRTTRVRRLVGQLVRRGFSPGLAFDILNELDPPGPASADEL